MKDAPISHDFGYVHTVIPAGMTIRQWRAQRAANRAAPRRAAPRGPPGGRREVDAFRAQWNIGEPNTAS